LKKLSLMLIISVFLTVFQGNMILASTQNLDISTVKIVHKESKRHPTADTLNQVIDKAIQARNNEMRRDVSTTPQNSSESTSSHSFNYITMDTEHQYIYEESPDSNPTLYIFNLKKNNVNQVVNSQKKSPKDAVSLQSIGYDFMPDGIGGRQKITLTNSNYLSTLVKLPNSAAGIAYNYAGWEYTAPGNGIGSIIADSGLVYDDSIGVALNKKGWKPSFILKQKQYNYIKEKIEWVTLYTGFVGGYDNVQYKNGYKVGSNVNLYSYYNYNGTARLKLVGTAICPNMTCTTETETNLTTIYDSGLAYNIGSVDYFKLVSSIVNPLVTDANRVEFSNTKVGNTAVPIYHYSTPEVDRASVTIDSQLKVTIICEPETLSGS
jgi:hypothetical protein